MADTTWYVNAASSAGGNGTSPDTSGANRAYNDISDFEAARQQDLRAGQGGIEGIATCSVAGGAYTDQVDFDGWTTDATHYINVVCDSSGRNNGYSRENTTDGDGTNAQIKRDAADNFIVREEYFRCDGLEIMGNNYHQVNLFVATTTTDIRFNDCIFLTSGATGTSFIVDAGATNPVSTFTDCLFVGDGWAMEARRWTTMTMDHCGIYTTGEYGLVASSESTVTNTWAAGTVDNDNFWTGGTPSGNNNASKDTSATSRYPTNSINSIVEGTEFTSASTTASSFDFTISSGNDLDGGGTNPSGLLDITDTAFSNPSAIGPWELIAAGGTNPRHLTLLGVG